VTAYRDEKVDTAIDTILADIRGRSTESVGMLAIALASYKDERKRIREDHDIAALRAQAGFHLNWDTMDDGTKHMWRTFYRLAREKS